MKQQHNIVSDSILIIRERRSDWSSFSDQQLARFDITTMTRITDKLTIED